MLDADGLTAFSENPSELFELIKQRAAPAILTPHAGEFNRLFPELDNAALQARARPPGGRDLGRGDRVQGPGARW